MNATTPEPAAHARPFVTRCRDGYDKTHPAVRTVYHYGWWSIFGMLLGYTAHSANRLQAALYKEILSLIQQGVLDVTDADVAVSYGPGLRWGVMG
jgi:hypothetical protein